MAKNSKGLNINGYKINFTNNTLEMNYSFSAAAAEYGSTEYNIYVGIHKDFPNIKDVVLSGREKKKPSKTRKISYAKFESYIKAVDDEKETIFTEYKKVKEMSKAQKSPYKYVCDWFEAQFPNYTETPSTVALATSKVSQFPTNEEETKKEAV